MAIGETGKGVDGSYEAVTTASRAAFDRAAAVMPGGSKGAYFYSPYPLFFGRGDGCRLTDIDGRTFLDCANHHTAQVLGRNHPAVVEAINSQVSRGVVLGGPTGVETELAEELCDRVASPERVRFCNSGTEATLHAIRLARGIPARSRIPKFDGRYHGSHHAAAITVAPPCHTPRDPPAPPPAPRVRGRPPPPRRDSTV